MTTERDWDSSKINWLLDVIAPDAQLATTVVMNFQQLTNDCELRIHPIVSKLIDREALQKMQSGTNATRRK